MEIINYDTLLEQYAGVAFEKQRSLAEVVGDNGWQVDMDKGTISFGSKLSFPIQILGTYSYESETWLWAWANEDSNLPENLLVEANELREFGEKYNIEFLTMDEFTMENTDVHSIGLIASGKFGSSAYYAGDFGSGIILLTLNSKEVDAVQYDEQGRILTVFPEIVNVFAVNHRRALKNYLEAKGYGTTEGEGSLSGKKGDNVIEASFDEKGRLTSMNGEIKS